MARGRTPIVFDDCGGRGCTISSSTRRYDVSSYPGFDYTTQAQPCASAGRSKDGKKTRSTCPVQLIFKNGQPKLRFCATQKQPGRVIPVDSAEEAQRISSELCACFKKNRKQWGKCIPAGPLGAVNARRRR